MPEPVKRGQRYMPGLDGLRAIAVLGVIAYHLGFRWIPGGLLGVGVFFTLSGYLITDLLLAQDARGGIDLRAFWLARARRLFPALAVLLVVVYAWVTVIGPHQPADFRTAVVTGALYVNNWFLIFHDVSYFQRFAAPEPLNHLWSLSVEEQFYILWPGLVLLGVRFVPEITVTRARLAGLTLLLGLASALLMAVIFKPGVDPSRVYYGTDTRAVELLVGAALAMVWPSRRLHGRVTDRARQIIDGAGVVGLLVIAVMFWRANEYDAFLYRGGFVLLSLGTALLVAALVHPASRLAPLVGNRPLRWIGERSYGIYLWHFPIIILTSPAGAHGVDYGRAFLQVAATIGVAALSWRFLEDPIRHGAIGRLRDAWREGRLHAGALPGRAYAGVGVSTVLLLAALAGLAGAGVQHESDKTPGRVSVAKTIKVAQPVHVANRPSCDGVVHIGDSTSEGLVSSAYLPDPKKLIAAQYARIGISTVHLEVSGARSIYERYKGQPNAYDVVSSWKSQGFSGCWVLALGTNEAANVAAGSQYSYDQRIDAMMQGIGDQPVMWVNVKSLVPAGSPYYSGNMRKWDDALRKACGRYPNMRIYDWARDVKDEWFIDDKIHFTSEGYAARGRLIANALRVAFRKGDPSPGGANCLVHPKVVLPPGSTDPNPPAVTTTTTTPVTPAQTPTPATPTPTPPTPTPAA